VLPAETVMEMTDEALHSCCVQATTEESGNPRRSQNWVTGRRAKLVVTRREHELVHLHEQLAAARHRLLGRAGHGDHLRRWDLARPGALPRRSTHYSLLESAKLTGIEPAGYLAQATRRAIASPGTVTLPRELRDA
jgi:hypothetical protein